MRKITINRPFFFSAIIELVQELLISNIHNKFEENMWKTFQVIAPTGSNYWRKMRKIAINRPFFFFTAIIELVQEPLISNMHNQFEEDMWKTFQVFAPTRSNYWRKMWKIAINRPFFFSAIIELVRELVISNMHNKFEKDTWKTFQVIAPTRSNYCRKMWKIAINLPFFFLAIIELVRELVISNMHNKFEKDTWKTFQVIALTRSNYWRERWKIAISRPFWIFFQPLLNLSEKWSLVTCKTHLGR